MLKNQMFIKFSNLQKLNLLLFLLIMISSLLKTIVQSTLLFPLGFLYLLIFT